MNYETWREPGAKGKTYLIFFGLKDTEEIVEAIKTFAREHKTAVKNVGCCFAWVKGEDLYLGNGPVVGARKAIAVYREVK